MEFGTLFDASEPVQIVLACDPAVVETSGELERGLYLLDGDTSRLKITEKAARVIIRAATPEDDHAVKREAGRFTYRGRRVAERLREHRPLKLLEQRVGLTSAKIAEIRSRLKDLEEGSEEHASLTQRRVELRDEMDDLASERADIVAEFLESLSDKDEESYQAWRMWEERQMRARVYRCLIGWENAEGAPNPSFEELGPEEFIRQAIPLHLQAEVVAELDSHITRISMLGEQGKALYARGFGSDQQSESTPPTTGSATSASEATNTSSGEEAVTAPSKEETPAAE